MYGGLIESRLPSRPRTRPVHCSTTTTQTNIKLLITNQIFAHRSERERFAVELSRDMENAII